jgi:hypothetical protein
VEVIQERQVAEPFEVGKALDQVRIELDPTADAHRRCGLDGHAGGLDERRSDDADRPV